ncbi:MAG: ABC transporter permease [Candidatus Hodarchaeales archaeon]|jgi:ABC-2 type transport system permease protein
MKIISHLSKSIFLLLIFKRLKYEITCAWEIMIKYWRIRLSYPLTFLFFASEPFIYLLPVIIYGQALVGGRESETLTNYAATGDIILFLTFGSAAMAILTRIYWMSAMGLRREEWTGTLISIYVTPASRFSIILGNTFFGISFSALAFLLQVGGVYVLYGLNINLFNFIPMFIILFFSTFSLLGFSLIISGLVLAMKQAWKFVLFMDGFLNMLAPAFFPLAILPFYLKPISFISPVTWGVEGFREGLIQGFSCYWFEILGYIFLLNIMWLSLGILIYNYFESRTRKKGMLGYY